MRKITSLILIIILLWMSGCASMKAQSDEDHKGENIKIVATSVAICQILDRLGYDHVIGIPDTASSLPQRYAELPTVGLPMTPDYEKIKSLSPDLVLSPKTLEESLSKDFTAAGISSAFLDLSSVEGMYKAIKSIGGLLDCEEEALLLIGEYEEYIANYETQINDQLDTLLLMVFPDGFYLVSTENSYVGNLIKLAGGKNVYGSNYKGDENGFASINPEDIVQKPPDIILIYAHYNEEAAFAFMRKDFETNPVWQYFDAVQKGNVYYLPSDKFGMSATLSWTRSLDYLSPILYGE